MVTKTHYRYWSGTYASVTNPGTDHKLKYVLRPENFQRFEDDSFNYLTATDTQLADYANVYLEYDSDYRVSAVEERGAACSGCGSGTSTGATTLTWTENGTPPADYDTWNLHCVVDRDDDTRIIFDTNKVDQVITWVFQDEDDGSPTREWIWHHDYSAGNRRTKAL